MKDNAKRNGDFWRLKDVDVVQCVLGSNSIVSHMVSPLYDDIFKIRMVLWNQYVCGFILVYVMPGYSHNWYG